MEIPQLVAHRGYPRRYPENTLEGINAAIAAGACHVEFDVQVTADGVPVLLHDDSLMRTTGTRGRIINTKLEKLAELPANQPKRFGTRHRSITIPTLAAAVELLIRHPRVTPFVEPPEESLEVHGREKVVKNVLAILAPLKARYVIISYDALSLRTARAMGAKRIGWVMRAWNEDSRARATALVPDYLICNYTKLPKDESQPLWFGPWQWMFYEVTQAKLALQLAERGASFIETMAIGEMLKNAQLKLAPELVRVQPFYLPLYKNARRGAAKIRLGLSLYALFAGLGRDGRFHTVPRTRWQQLDGLDCEQLRTVFCYPDAQTDDAALTRAVMHSAVTLGAELRVPAPLLHAEYGRDGVRVRYYDGETYECQARVRVNAAGPWANEALARIEPQPPHFRMDLVQGTHILVPGRLTQGIYYLEVPRDGRAIFVMPWREHTLVGTTETRYHGAPGAVQPLAAEIYYLW